MPQPTLPGIIKRMDFSKIPSTIEIPDLVEVQKRSYEAFLQKDADAEHRAEKGLQAALMSVYPISDYNYTAILEFTNYSLGTLKYDVRDCLEQVLAFAAPLKLRLRLVVLVSHDNSC